MPELTIKYKNKKTLAALQSMAAYFGFSIVEKNDVNQDFYLNGVKVIAGNGELNVKELEEIFSESNLEASKLRKEAWQR